MAPTIRVNSPPHMGFLFFSWFHRGWRVLLQLPAVGLGELDVTPLVGNGTELSELFDLSLGCETFMKTHWFRWCERKGGEDYGAEGMKSTPGPEQGAIRSYPPRNVNVYYRKRIDSDEGWVYSSTNEIQNMLRNGHFNHRIRNKFHS